MALIDEVKAICTQLAPAGWADLFAAFGLNLRAANLARELARPLSKLAGARPGLAGFEDLSRAALRGAEPGAPDRSLLYHGLASPGVVLKVDGSPLDRFPTPAQLDTIENYIYSLGRPSATLASLRQTARRRAGLSASAAASLQFAVAVFACEYRPASQSIDHREAGMCFSRTGVARVGTAPLHYSPAGRGFLPARPGRPHEFAVLPARYAPYLAFRARPAAAAFGPMRPRNGDGRRSFWVPFHKLFPGGECVRDLDLAVTLAARHVNDKLRRVHLRLGPGKTNIPGPDLDAPPFVIRDEEIAAFSNAAEFGAGLLVPAVHPRLVEAARAGGRLLAFRVPPNPNNLSSSFTFEMPGRARNAPEYVHARSRLENDGSVTDLNDPAQVPDVKAAVDAGGYFAVHYVDFTGDGWISAECPQLARFPSLPAYSLVTAPDFFFNTSQRDLMDWTEDDAQAIPPPIPQPLRNTIWRIAPETLADGRDAVNFELNDFGAGLDRSDKTMTAVIGLALPNRTDAGARLPEPDRHAWLPDAASGVFAPGWDTSLARTGNVDHLAAYGLGSPFPEDAKLCAALSTFWPAVAPDAARVFNPNATGEAWPTVCPLTDEEIGLGGGLPFDGYAGPRLRPDGRVEYTALDYGDYVRSALDGKFTAILTSRLTAEEYRTRALAMARVYRALGITSTNPGTSFRQKAQWAVLSFRPAGPAEAELAEAEQHAGVSLQGAVYRFQLYRHGEQTRQGNKMLVKVEPDSMTVLFVDARQILRRQGGGAWQRVAV